MHTQKPYYSSFYLLMLLVLTASLNGCASLDGLGGTITWTEEARLHDGQTILVERAQTFDGNGLREIGQGAPLSLEVLNFETPKGKSVRWTSDYGRGYQDNLAPLVLDIIEGVPYLVAYPTRCHAYNKWERPNPPYVFFRYDGNRWQRIAIDEVPRVMNRTNLSLAGSQSRAMQLTREMGSVGYVSAEQIQERQRNMTPDSAYLREIVWQQMKKGWPGCGEMIYDGRGGWFGLGWFRDKPSLDACNKYCERKKIEPEYCPCETLFKEGK